MNKKLILVFFGIAVFGAVLNAQTSEPVSLASIMGVTAPVSGATPARLIIETAQYNGNITWSPAVSDVFQPVTQYTATITLIAKTGYTFQGVPANFFTVSGAASVRNNANSGVITAVFPATTVVIDIAAIQGVTAPAAGVAPVTAITETAQYSGTVTWSPQVSGVFEHITMYTAAITLTAKPGYTLQGVPVNFFKVAGAITVRNNADSGVITAVFPMSSVTTNIAAIRGVTPPAAGKTPVTEITETEQYSGTITWSPEVPETFEPGTRYTATITLAAKPGYTVEGVPANFFKVAWASSSCDAGSGVITAAFAPTKYPEDAKLWSAGASLGTSFGAPLFIATARGTIAPFKDSLFRDSFFRNTFFEVGVDAGLGSGYKDIEYFSLYPLSITRILCRSRGRKAGKGGGFYAGAGFGVMFANSTFKVEGPIWENTFAMNLVIGANIFDMFDISYTLQTNFLSANNKLAIGYVYRFK